MAVQRRVNWLSQQRVDVPDMRSLESASSNDFDQLIQSWVTGTNQGYIVRGFNILMSGAISNAASSLQMQVDPGAVLHIAASQSGTFLMVPAGTPAQQLNSAINTNVVGSFTPNSVNYVSIDYIRFIDDTTSAQVYVWNPTTNTETTKNAPRAQILQYVINISTVTPTANLLPIAVVNTDAGNNVTQVTDARWMFCRLGSGGLTPDPLFSYPWLQGRNENPSSSTSSTDPFTGGDKNIGSLKEWMNALMSIIKEIKGTTYWYSTGSSTGSLESLRQDVANTVITGSGNISHGIIPNSEPILITTGNITSGSNQLTALASATGLLVGQYIVGTGIPAGTTILSIAGPVVTMSETATLNGTGISVSFYNPSVITAPGQINWDEPINIAVISSKLSYILDENDSTTDITLADDQVAYLQLIRDVAVAPNLVFTNGSATVTSVGAIPWTAPLLAGDFIKLASDSDAQYYEILSVDSLIQVTLTSFFAGASTGVGGAQAQYTYGSYTHSPTPIGNNRAIQIAARPLVPENGDVFWLFMREDNSGAPRVYIRFLGIELNNGEDRQVSGPVPAQLLLYVGSPIISASRPLYVSALNPGSLEEIQTLTFGTAAQTPNNSYFLINSSGNARQYYVWFNKDGLGVQPFPPNTNTAIEVDISTGQTSAQIAEAVKLKLNDTFYNDFSAVRTLSSVQVTNTSAGTSTVASDGNVGAPFAVVENQAGTGTGNNVIKDGDNLTLAIKELDRAIGSIFGAIDSPTYDEQIDIVASGGVPPDTINGPVPSGTILQLPLNSRLGFAVQRYTVGDGHLEVYLNGQFLHLGDDWNEIGAAGALSSSFQTLWQLEVGDLLELRIIGIGAGGVGGNPGPQGAPGPAGPPGSDAVGGPIAISTKVANYTVLLTDNVLRANCAAGSVTFTLPPAATSTGRVFWFKKIDGTANAMIIDANGVELIDGALTKTTIIQYESFTVISDGTSWGIY